MTKKRRQYDAQYKFRVALEAAKGNKTINELASETGVHPNQIGAWKRQLLENGAELFSRDGNRGHCYQLLGIKVIDFYCHHGVKYSRKFSGVSRPVCGSTRNDARSQAIAGSGSHNVLVVVL